ncbi:MAG: TolC family protein, partial [Kiritimatiellae bacterium]|nr:TolC family protein [Kiritimatiellia bacterium]
RGRGAPVDAPEHPGGEDATHEDAAEPLDLPAALEQALAHNRDLVRAALELRGNELDVRQAESDFALRLRPDADIGFSDVSDTWAWGAGLVRKLSPGTEVELGGRMTRTETDTPDGDTRRARLQVEIRQPIFRNYGALVHREGVVSARSSLTAARRTFERQKEDLVIQLVQTYETIIQLEQRILSDEAFFARMDKLYRLTKARESQGQTTRVDTLRVDLQRGQAQSRLQDNREQIEQARRELAELLGLPLDSTFEMEPPPLLDIDLPPLEQAVRVAIENRLDYAQVLHDLRDARRGVRLARRGLYPDLALVTRYERFGEGARTSDAQDLEQDGWFVGLASGTDFNPARERAGLARAKVDEMSTRQVIAITEQSVARDVQQRMSDYRRAVSEKKTAESNYRLAGDRAVLARRLFELGRGDNFSVTDAEQALVAAEARVLAARAEISLAGYRLMRSLGTLIEHPAELKPEPAREEL